MPDAVLVQPNVDLARIALRHMDIVDAERRIGRVAERRVGLVRIVLGERVAVEKDVVALRLGEVQHTAEAMHEPIVARALRRQDPHRIRVEEIAALVIYSAAVIRPCDRRKSLRPGARIEGTIGCAKLLGGRAAAKAWTLPRGHW